MNTKQPDLFAAEAGPLAPEVSEELRAMMRGKLQAVLERVQTAAMIPWDNSMELVRLENFVRYNKGILPADEAAALWAAFDVEMVRLYAVLNEGIDMAVEV